MFRMVWVIGGVGEGKKCSISLGITRDIRRTKNIDNRYALNEQRLRLFVINKNFVLLCLQHFSKVF